MPETVEASLQLSEALLVEIGVPMGLVIASIHEKRDEVRQSLRPRGPLVPAEPPKAAGGSARSRRPVGETPRPQ